MVYDALPFQIKDADQRIRKKHFPNCLLAQEGVLVGPKEYFLDPSFREYGLDIYNFEARKDDVYLVGHLRSGTTLHCELVWLIGNDLDYKTAKEKLIDDRFCHIDEAIMQTDITIPHQHIYVEKLAAMTERRFVKAHIPLSLMPPSIWDVGAKVIYVARNAKDVIVSHYYAYQLFYDNEHIIESIEQYFTQVKMNWGWFLPYFEHIKEAWNKRHEKNFLFLFYEDYIKDSKNTISKVAKFLDKELTKQQIGGLLEHLDIENFRKNKSVNLDYMKTDGVSRNMDFIRKGGIGGWRDYFVGPLLEEVDAWIQSNLQDTDLRFPE